MKACYYISGTCAECNVQIHAHGWHEPDALRAFGEALEHHIGVAHFVGEAVEIVDAMVAEVTTV